MSGVGVISWTGIASHLVVVTFEQFYSHMFHLYLVKRSNPQHRDGSVMHEIAAPFLQTPQAEKGLQATVIHIHRALDPFHGPQ